MIIGDTIEIQINGELIDITAVWGLKVQVLESIYGKSLYRIRFADRDVARWNAIAESTDIKATLRWGAQMNTKSQADWSNWRRFRITQVNLASDGNIVRVQLTGSDILFDFKNQAPQRVFKEKKISEMLKEIAQSYNIESDLVGTTDKYTLRQGHASDYRFIVDDLLPRTRVRNPDEVFLFYVKHKSLAGRTHIVLSSLNELEKKGPELTFSYEELGTTSKLDPLGRAFLTFYYSTSSIGSASFGTATNTFDVKKEKGDPYLFEDLANDDTEDYPTLGADKPETLSILGVPAEVNSIVIDNLNLDFETELKCRTDWRLDYSNRLAIPTALLHKVEPGVLAQVDAKVVDGQPIFSTGVFVVYAVYHVISGRKSRTITFLERRGVSKAA